MFGDAAATIQNIEASELLYRSGIYVGLLSNSINMLAVLIILGKPDFLSVFGSAQLEGAAYLFVRLQSHGTRIIQIFWGLWLVIVGARTPPGETS